MWFFHSPDAEFLWTWILWRVRRISNSIHYTYSLCPQYRRSCARRLHNTYVQLLLLVAARVKLSSDVTALGFKSNRLYGGGFLVTPFLHHHHRSHTLLHNYHCISMDVLPWLQRPSLFCRLRSGNSRPLEFARFCCCGTGDLGYRCYGAAD